MINLAIADDHALIREGLSKIIGFEEDMKIVIDACSGEDLIKGIEKNKPNVVLLDINMDNLDGIETLKIIKQRWINLKVIMLTVEKQKRKVKEALSNGADGYILKESAGSDITNAIRAVNLGGKYIDHTVINNCIFDTSSSNEEEYLSRLTQRELTILVSIADGLKNKEIADNLFLSEKTIKNYVTSIFKKINVEDRIHATLFAIENNAKDFLMSNFTK